MKPFGLQIGPDSISQSRAASKTRYAGACHLEKAGFTVGAIYLFGYSVEIILVATYFEMKGFKKTQAIDYNARSRVVHVARQRKLMGSEPHDILGWARLLVEDRPLLVGKSFETKFADSMIEKADALRALWSPRLRYHQIDIKQPQVAATRTIADWFQRHLNT